MKFCDCPCPHPNPSPASGRGAYRRLSAKAFWSAALARSLTRKARAAAPAWRSCD
ncbi:hypothetical protein [Lysobacter gummosus]|uniref:hypothetical protein n=1 Tax=Lysobacter gummosus TaxID=262324 RepID=UPI00362C4B66